MMKLSPLCLTMLLLATASIEVQAQQNTQLSNQAQAGKQKALALSLTKRPTNRSRLEPQVLRADRNKDCTLNIGAGSGNSVNHNRLANSRVAPQQETIVVQASPIVVCGR